jgi:hypothetical protein
MLHKYVVSLTVLVSPFNVFQLVAIYTSTIALFFFVLAFFLFMPLHFIFCVRFQALAAVIINITIFWSVTP